MTTTEIDILMRELDKIDKKVQSIDEKVDTLGERVQGLESLIKTARLIGVGIVLLSPVIFLYSDHLK